MAIKSKWCRFGFLLLARQWRWLAAVAVQEGMSMAAVMRTLIENAMRQERPVEYNKEEDDGIDRAAT